MHQCQTLEKEKLLHLEIHPAEDLECLEPYWKKTTLTQFSFPRNIAMISDKFTIWIEAFNNIQSVPM